MKSEEDKEETTKDENKDEKNFNFNFESDVDSNLIASSSVTLSKTEIEKSWIRLGSSSDPRPLNPGNKDYGLVRFQIPSDAPLCIIRFNLEVSKGNAHYASDFFDLEITT